MQRVLLLKAWTNKKSATVGLVAFVADLLWPSIPLRSVDVWLKTLSLLYPTNLLYPILAFLTGSYVAIYFYNKRVETCCSVNSVRTGTAGSLIGIFLGVCPACVPVLAFLLPLGLTLTLSHLSPFLLAASIGILLFAVHRMNGFRRIEAGDTVVTKHAIA